MRPQSTAGGEAAPDPDTLARLAVAAKRLIDSAIRTDAALPDRERRYLDARHNGSPVPELTPAERQREWGLEAAIAAAEEARIAQARRAGRYRPSPEEIGRYDTVMGWLAWLKRQPEGVRDCRILIARAHKVPRWRLAQRHGRSEETIRRWEGAAVAAIVGRFWREIARLATGEKP